MEWKSFFFGVEFRFLPPFTFELSVEFLSCIIIKKKNFIATFFLSFFCTFFNSIQQELFMNERFGGLTAVKSVMDAYYSPTERPTRMHVNIITRVYKVGGKSDQKNRKQKKI